MAVLDGEDYGAEEREEHQHEVRRDRACRQREVQRLVQDLCAEEVPSEAITT